MAQANLTIRIDNSDKKAFAEICKSMGLSVSAAYNVFTKAVIRSRKIPFEVQAQDDDGFYNPANIRHLEEQVKLYNEGKMKFVTKTLEELEELAK
ncbi:MAG: type II toxin-antitoxin system RelB/DinJ family antitoxin [Treponema sp.]|nr:type II toxin-antitoxin system RelB/DinJ family antitoxin [Treponema sp.]MCR5318520.1 type II toxin-antitoxin system RelB/DinJ family antitoxin [Treponema sp.]HBB14732.1 type II toxin-antitoxin system antitoxin, RelB/DinJ family [Treponema sp.]